MDFFVISGIQNFNMGIKKTKMSIIDNEGVFVMQHYVASKEDQCIKYRGCWKKDKGFKFYKLSSVIPLNG